jgi:hypothetical protein
VQGDALQQQLAAVSATEGKLRQQPCQNKSPDGVQCVFCACVQGDALQQQLAAVSATEGKLRQQPSPTKLLDSI